MTELSLGDDERNAEILRKLPRLEKDVPRISTYLSIFE